MNKINYQLLKLKNFREFQLKQLSNFKNAKVYLEMALSDYKKDKDADAFLHAIRDVADAQIKWCEIVERASLHQK